MLKYLITIVVLLFTEIVSEEDKTTTTPNKPTAKTPNTTSSEKEGFDYEYDESDDVPEDDFYEDENIFHADFGDGDMQQLQSTDDCYNHFKVFKYKDEDIADPPESSNGFAMIVMDDGCGATPILNLTKGTYFSIHSKSLSKKGGIITVWQDSASQNYSATHAAGCWVMDEGDLQPRIGRVYFRFEFNSDHNPAEYAFVVDNIEIRGTISEYRPKPKDLPQIQNSTMRKLQKILIYIVLPAVAIIALLIVYAFFNPP